MNNPENYGTKIAYKAAAITLTVVPFPLGYLLNQFSAEQYSSERVLYSVVTAASATLLGIVMLAANRNTPPRGGTRNRSSDGIDRFVR